MKQPLSRRVDKRGKIVCAIYGGVSRSMPRRSSQARDLGRVVHACRTNPKKGINSWVSDTVPFGSRTPAGFALRLRIGGPGGVGPLIEPPAGICGGLLSLRNAVQPAPTWLGRGLRCGRRRGSGDRASSDGWCAASPGVLNHGARPCRGSNRGDRHQRAAPRPDDQIGFGILRRLRKKLEEPR